MEQKPDPKTRQEINPQPKPSKPRVGPTLNGSYSGPKTQYPNPPDTVNPDQAALREQWRYAIRQYSKWYSHAWGTAILAGASFFALGWFVKGGNPLPSFKDPNDSHSDGKDE